MKIRFLITTLCLVVCFSLIPTLSMAAPEDADFSTPYKKILIRQEDGSMVDSQQSAYIGRYETLVPFQVVKDISGADAVMDELGGRLAAYFPNPSFTMETPALTEFMKDGADIVLRGSYVGDSAYLNLNGLEKLLGIAVTKSADNQSIVLEKMKAGTERRLNKVRPGWKPTGKISLVWDHLTGGTPPDLSAEEKIPGLSVISPTWFAVVDARGTIASRADFKYVRDARDKGYKVWPLISNSFDPDMTHEFLADESAQDRAIRQLLLHAAIYDLDGINIDFENVHDVDKDRLTAFVAKLYEKIKQQNVTLSIDTTVPSPTPNWSACYDRAELAKVVDYFMVMTYDEHWRTSPIAGSVASIGWVEQGIINMLQYVPKEKLLMGVPFYTREWRETDLGYGRVRARSSTMWMSDVDDRIQQLGLQPEWLDSVGQYYTEYEQNGYRYRIWIEDVKSLTLKTEMVKKYELAGVAAWRKGFEKPGIWEAIDEVLKKAVSPVEPAKDIIVTPPVKPKDLKNKGK